MPPRNKKPNELNIVRVYDAPVKAVWDAWTDPKQAAKWWGPRGHSITTHSKDLRPGGSWKYTMHGPEGAEYPNDTKYFEVEEYKKLVYDHGANEHQPPLFRVTVLFSETNGKTTMDMTMAFATAEAATEIKKFVKIAKGNSTWDRLGEFLAKESTGKEKFIINRTFDAPIEKMFEVWTDPNHLAKWLAPTGMDMKFFRSEIKEGKSTFYSMSAPGGVNMLGRAEYLKIEKPNQLIYTQQFCDENEKATRHPMAPTWPETMLTVVNFVAESPDSTRVTIQWEPFGNVTAEEIKAFVEMKTGMTQGWSGSFEKLETYLGITSF